MGTRRDDACSEGFREEFLADKRDGAPLYEYMVDTVTDAVGKGALMVRMAGLDLDAYMTFADGVIAGMNAVAGMIDTQERMSTVQFAAYLVDSFDVSMESKNSDE